MRNVMANHYDSIEHIDDDIAETRMEKVEYGIHKWR